MQTVDQQVHSPMSAELLALLRCTACRASLNEKEDGYVCSTCGQKFPRVRGLLRFVDAHSYADSFGFQWHKFDRTQLDHAGMDLSDPDFRRKTGLKPEDLKG